MEYKFTILGRLDGLNEYTAANRTNPHKGGKMKRDNEDTVIWSIRQQLRGLHINRPVLIYYSFYEPNSKRDNDNILSGAAKFIQDSLVKTNVLVNDNQKCIHNFYFDTFVDNKNPRIEVLISELSNDQFKMNLSELLRDLGR
ncbi:MAG: Holliday junction resolvase [Anaerocolumna sp.]|jgi:Holliday junction resolvase RusA-like endonuclease|nr:Holliday junction resolvase [Anaerocolumna sp.]